MTDDVTTTTWNTKLLNAWIRFYAWAKLHPGIMIPLACYLAGIATIPLLKRLF